jgi:hypothetical protein
MPLSTSILCRLRHQHETIHELIGSLSEQQLRQRVNPEKWSAYENIAHLAVYHQVFLRRVQRIQEEEVPFFPRYVAEDDPDFPVWLQSSLSRLLGMVQESRQSLISLLESMDETSLQRIGRHARYGRLTVVQWVEFFLLHEAHHLYTIFMIVQELHKGLTG